MSRKSIASSALPPPHPSQSTANHWKILTTLNLLYATVPLAMAWTTTKDLVTILLALLPIIQILLGRLYATVDGVGIYVTTLQVLYVNPIIYTIFSILRRNEMAAGYVRLLATLQCVDIIPTLAKGRCYVMMLNVITASILQFLGADNSLAVFVAQSLIQFAAVSGLARDREMSCSETQTECKEFTGIEVQTDKAAREDVCTQCDKEEKHDLAIQTDGKDVYYQFFHTLQHPAFLVDLNVNVEAAAPSITNPSAKKLLQSNKCLFEYARLETSKCTLNELMSLYRRRVDHPSLKTDRIKVESRREEFRKESPDSESGDQAYDVTIATFDTTNDSQMLGIVMMEVPKDREKEKQILERFKNSLLCSLSHELFSPINALILALGLLPSGKAEQKEDYKAIALANAELLCNKIRDLIDYSKIELNSFKLQESEFCVETLFEELERILTYVGLLKENKLCLKTKTCANRKLLIHADKERIKQVLIKLIVNAIKYTVKGKIKVEAAEKADDLDVVFSVSDTGVGMEKKKLDQIFASLPEKAKFLHEHNDYSTKLPGLGLEIAKRICEHMGGILRATSVPGKGSVFSFEVPVCRIYTTPVLEPPEPQEPEDKKENVLPPPMNLQLDLSRIRLNGKIHTRNHTMYPPTINTNPVLGSLVSSDEGKTLGAKGQKLPQKRRGSLHTYKRLASEEDVRDTNGLRGCHVAVPNSPSKQAAKNDGDEIAIESHGENDNLSIKMRSYSKELWKIGRNAAERRSVTDSSLNGHRALEEEKSKDVLSPSHEKIGVVLITDDDSFNRVVLRGMLKNLSVKTIEAANGQEAVNVMVEAMSGRLGYMVMMVLMDLNMPTMDGIQATREIRKLERARKLLDQVPIIAVSAHDSPKDRALCAKVGMQEFIAKPTRAIDIERVVQSYVMNNFHQMAHAFWLTMITLCCLMMKAKANLNDTYWTQIWLVMCTMLIASASTLSLNLLLDKVPWQIFFAYNPFQFLAVLSGSILTNLFASFLLLPLFFSIGVTNRIYERILRIGGYLLATVATLSGLGLVIAYFAVLTKLRHIFIFEMGLAEGVVGFSIFCAIPLVYSLTGENKADDDDTKVYAVITRQYLH